MKTCEHSKRDETVPLSHDKLTGIVLCNNSFECFMND
jgi:hypothetical protein